MGRITIALMAVGLATPLLLFAGVSRLHAGTVLIDFEKYADGYNLNGLNLGGVTLTNPSGKVEVFDNRFGVGYHSATKSIASPAGLSSVNPLVGVFDAPVSYVSLWGGDSGWDPTEMDSWQLRAYDAQIGGNLVGNVSSGSWVGSPYRPLSITAASILRFEALWTGPRFGIGYDDLSFVPAPPPLKSDPPPPDPLPSDGWIRVGVIVTGTWRHIMAFPCTGTVTVTDSVSLGSGAATQPGVTADTLALEAGSLQVAGDMLLGTQFVNAGVLQLHTTSSSEYSLGSAQQTTTTVQDDEAIQITGGSDPTPWSGNLLIGDLLADGGQITFVRDGQTFHITADSALYLQTADLSIDDLIVGGWPLPLIPAPEPSALALLATALLCLLAWRRRRPGAA